MFTVFCLLSLGDVVAGLVPSYFRLAGPFPCARSAVAKVVTFNVDVQVTASSCDAAVQSGDLHNLAQNVITLSTTVALADNQVMTEVTQCVVLDGSHVDVTVRIVVSQLTSANAALVRAETILSYTSCIARAGVHAPLVAVPVTRVRAAVAFLFCVGDISCQARALTSRPSLVLWSCSHCRSPWRRHHSRLTEKVRCGVAWLCLFHFHVSIPPSSTVCHNV